MAEPFRVKVAEAIRSRGKHLVLPLILLLAFALRIWGIDFGLPNTLVRPDETTLVHRALAIAAGDLNPHFFRYPSLHFYTLAVVYGVYFLVGRVTGHFDGVEDFQYEFFTEPSTIFILGRLLTAFMGTASVALVYLIATKWRGRAAGVLSALFLSVSFLHVRDSHFLTLDVPSTWAGRFWRLPRLDVFSWLSGVQAGTWPSSVVWPRITWSPEPGQVSTCVT